MRLGISKAKRVIDTLLDVGGQGNITPLLPLSPLRLRKLRDTTTSSGLHDLASDNDTSITDTLNAGVYEALVNLIGI
jgi:hypothetical protein